MMLGFIDKNSVGLQVNLLPSNSPISLKSVLPKSSRRKSLSKNLPEKTVRTSRTPQKKQLDTCFKDKSEETLKKIAQNVERSINFGNDIKIPNTKLKKVHRTINHTALNREIDKRKQIAEKFYRKHIMPNP